MSNNKPSLIPNSLRNASVEFPYVAESVDIYDKNSDKNQEQINADTYRKSETYSKEQVDSLAAAFTAQNYLTYTADDQTTSIEDVLPDPGAKNTVYRVGNWDGEQYDPTVYSEYAWMPTGEDTGEYRLLDVKQYTLATAEDFIEPDAEKRSKVASVGAVADVYGSYKESHEYISAKTDRDGHLLEGTTTNGDKEFTKNVKIGGILNIGGTQIYKTDQPDYINAETDNQNKVLEGRRKDSVKEFNTPIIIQGFEQKAANNQEYVFAFVDKDERIVFGCRKDGKCFAQIVGLDEKIKELISQMSDWNDKVLSTYGDSITAENNGNFEYPYQNISTNWGNRVADYFRMAKQYGRGIGGQGYKWNTGVGRGGSVSWVNTTGVLINRLDEFNYDNWDGTTYPSGVTPEMEQQGTAIRIRGCLSSWLRITKMFPASIKDTIDVVLVMAHNDDYDSTPCSFVANDTTDTEWANSGNDYYGKINGDYNINTFKGGVASTLMKLQLWMPNAVIVLMTGVSGQGTTGELNLNINYSGGLNKAEAIREMSKLTSIPCIDTYASDGINGWNRTAYISDNIHPNTTYGRKMFARAIIGGMKTILPKEEIY